MPRSRVDPVPKAKARMYLRRAMNFMKAAEWALKEGNFDAAALGSVHSVISACNAITVHCLGLRSSAPDHLEVVALLSQAGAPGRLLAQVRETISRKTAVECEAKDTSELDAEGLVTRARRVLSGAESLVAHE